jgi:hypothetical protein
MGDLVQNRTIEIVVGHVILALGFEPIVKVVSMFAAAFLDRLLLSVRCTNSSLPSSRQS